MPAATLMTMIPTIMTLTTQMTISPSRTCTTMTALKMTLLTKMTPIRTTPTIMTATMTTLMMTPLTATIPTKFPQTKGYYPLINNLFKRIMFL